MPATATRRVRAHRILLVALVIAGLVAPGVPTPASASLVGQLSGTVTGGGAVLPNVWVTLTPVTAKGDPSGTPTRTLTDESGTYAFPEIDDRAVKVQVRAPLFGQLVDTYWPGVHSFAQAGIIEISNWPVTADVDLPVGISVTGRVVDAQTGAPVPDARVSAVIAAAPLSRAVGAADQADGPGAFALSGLPPVPMQLRVRLPPGSSYLAAGPGAPSEGVRIDGASSRADVVIGLRRGAEIRGTVRDDTGAPVAGALIKLVGCLPNCPLIATSSESGAYRLLDVSPGTRLGVVAWKGDELLRQWYPGRDNAARATDIALAAGEVLDEVDFALTRGAFVTVGVFGVDSGAPLPTAIVQLTSSDDPFERYFAQRTSDGPGRMRVGPVPPGTYMLSVTPGAANPGYLPVVRLVDTEAAPQGILELGPEDDLDLVAALPRAGMGAGAVAAAPQESHAESTTGRAGADASGCRGDAEGRPWPGCAPAAPDRWPGLAQGFLAPGA